MNKKTIIAIGLTASTIFSGLVARQVIGSQAADRCQTSVDSYTLLAEAQIEDMNTAKNMVNMIVENPFSAFMVGGELVRIGNQAEARWDDINEASDLTDEVCVNEGLMATITDPYTIEAVGEKAQVKKNLEDTQEALMEAGKALGW